MILNKLLPGNITKQRCRMWISVTTPHVKESTSGCRMRQVGRLRIFLLNHWIQWQGWSYWMLSTSRAIGPRSLMLKSPQNKSSTAVMDALYMLIWCIWRKSLAWITSVNSKPRRLNCHIKGNLCAWSFCCLMTKMVWPIWKQILQLIIWQICDSIHTAGMM